MPHLSLGLRRLFFFGLRGSLNVCWGRLTVIGILLLAVAEAAPAPVLPGIGVAVQSFVDRGAIAGAVTMVVSRDSVLHLQATGVSNIASRRPMAPDDLFWIASMTKPITGTAVLMLQDEGRLNVSDLVERYIPEFAALRTPSGRLAHVTIAQLLTHTSGLSEGTGIVGNGTLGGFIPFYVASPTLFEPGSDWEYSNSGLNAAARVVEVVSGLSFDTFLRQRLFQPLGMADTTFYPTPAQRSRLATSYRNDQGTLVPTLTTIPEPNAVLGDHYWAPYGSGGLYSTAADYARFCQMILNGGELDGRRYLSPEAVRMMTSIQTGELVVGSGMGYGYGWRIVREPIGTTAALSPGSFGHSGAYATQAWIDPGKGVVFVVMVQLTGSSEGNNLTASVQQAAVEALNTPPAIVLQPRDCTIAAGDPLALTVAAVSNTPSTFQWRKDGVDLPGATEASLVLTNVAASSRGDYAVVVSNKAGSTTSRSAVVRVAGGPPARLANLAVRATVTTDRPLTVGFVTQGTKCLLVRGIGPGLAPFGIPTFCADPQLEISQQTGTILATNDNWPTTLNDTFTSVGAFSLSSGSKDAALVQTVNGAHVALVSGKGAGIALVEIYATDADRSSYLQNFSALQFVGTGDDILIAGFVIDGPVAKTLLVRAVGGAKLASFNVAGTLTDPKLELFDGAGVCIATNDNWSAQLAPLEKTAGAFDLDAGSTDAALLITLQPGSYTAQVSGVGEATGVALVEIYDVSR